MATFRDSRDASFRGLGETGDDGDSRSSRDLARIHTNRHTTHPVHSTDYKPTTQSFFHSKGLLPVEFKTNSRKRKRRTRQLSTHSLHPPTPFRIFSEDANPLTSFISSRSLKVHTLTLKLNRCHTESHRPLSRTLRGRALNAVPSALLIELLQSILIVVRPNAIIYGH